MFINIFIIFAYFPIKKCNVPRVCNCISLQTLIFLMTLGESHLFEEFERLFISPILKREKRNDVVAKEAFRDLTPF